MAGGRAVRGPAGLSVARWTDPAFIEEAHAWLRQQALGLGMGTVGTITQPHVRPWSTVFRATTSRGSVFLKACGPSQAHEPALTALLARDGGLLVREPLAIHPTEPWMLLSDGGIRLREAFDGEALFDAWMRILPRYAELQRRLLDQDDELLASGLPDRRLDQLAEQLAAVLQDDRVFATGPSAHAEAIRDRLRRQLPALAARCAELAALGIGATVQHDDLHDGNVLIGASEGVFDWGDACLTHPFLTLRVALRGGADPLGAADDDPRLLRLRDAYLEPWRDLASPVTLREAAELGRVLGQVTRTLSWYQVVTLVDGAMAAEPDVISRSLAGLEELLAR